MIERRFLLASLALTTGLPLWARQGQPKQPSLVPMPVETNKPGIEVLISDHLALLKDKRVGLVTNHTGVNRRKVHDIDLLLAAGGKLVALFGPEHGLRGLAQAGEKVDSGTDAPSGLPVYSLYGKTKQPTPEMLKGIDVLLFDMQDIGARFYTYHSTLLYVLRAAAKAKIPVIVLDRPNPLGGELIEGPVLEPPYASFVGVFAMPVVHGMTMGELARMFVGEEKLKVQLTVIQMQWWRRERWRQGFTDNPWIAPSPNIPTRLTAGVYPGTALFEGTNVSEGRGTDRPFEQIGAPFIHGETLAAKLMAANIAGVHFKQIAFTPSSSKFAGQSCSGVLAIVTDSKKFNPFATGVAMVKAVHDLYPEQFKFREGKPSYFDQLAGVGYVREDIIAGKSVAEIEAKWIAGAEAFREKRKKYLLY